MFQRITLNGQEVLLPNRFDAGQRLTPEQADFLNHALAVHFRNNEEANGRFHGWPSMEEIAQKWLRFWPRRR